MTSQAERRERNFELRRRGFTEQDIVHLMDDTELRANVRRGGVLAIEEMRDRELKLLESKDLDIGV